MISILEDAGYAGVISLELFNPSYWEQDPAEVARICSTSALICDTVVLI